MVQRLATNVELTTNWSETDRAFMDRAVELARTATGRVAPNPAVGAVVVRGGRIVAEGATQPPPGPHAEVVALDAAGELACDADLYVTLEPCSHWGRTPPCVDAIVRAGVRRVIVATLDPFHLVNGRGVEHLLAHGIEVVVGCQEQPAQEIIAGFRTRIELGRPRTIAKYAMTLDGRIATHTGHSRWISGPESRQYVHQVRDRVDAILVGIGTALADDPQLTTRIPDHLAGYNGPHHPLRVVLDSNLRLPSTARMLQPDTPGETLIYTAQPVDSERAQALSDAGVEIVSLPDPDGRVDLAAMLADLGQRGINDLLIEGGGEVLGALFDHGLIDHAMVFIAPVIVGGAESPSPVGGVGVERMPDAWRLEDRTVTTFGDDVLIAGRVVRGEGVDDV